MRILGYGRTARGESRREDPGACGIDRLAVVIPAHNEEQHLERALSRVQAAAEALPCTYPSVSVGIVVVLDACTDGSARVARRFAAADPRFEVVGVDFRSVGRSRRAGVQALLPQGPDEWSVPPSKVWIANTDADSSVPRHWLVRQLELAAAGADVVVGSVEPDVAGMDPALVRLWHSRHRLEENHPHVHGANLGVRASAYLAAGGFPLSDCDEDRTLVDRLRRSGAAVYATDTTRVVTSGRLEARTVRGFAAYLLALARECSDVPGGQAQ